MTGSGVLTASVIAALLIQVFFFSATSSAVFEPCNSRFDFPPNGKLQEVIKLGEGTVIGPEDVAFDSSGVLYTATRDGAIKRMYRNGTWDIWWQSDTDGLLGLTVTAAGRVIVCGGSTGLLKVGDEGMTVLTSYVNGSRLKFPNDVVEASDGTLYFTQSSTKYGVNEPKLDLLEGNPYGQLLKYDPVLNETSILLEHLYFANGIALSKHEDFLIVSETWKYRCFKYWLKGERKGQTEIFVDNLPGGPDNINIAPDGSFWIALLEVKPDISESKRGMVVNIASDGSFIRGFDDPTGEVMSFVTSGVEFEHNLYLGSGITDFVGKLPLDECSGGDAEIK